MTRGSLVRPCLGGTSVPPVTATRAIGAAVVLGGPLVLSFYSGGFFAEPRLWAALITWAALGALVVSGQHAPLPRSTPGRVAIAGLAALTVLTGLSIAWAPLGGPAQADLQRLLLHLGAFTLGAAVLTGPAGRATEPVLGFGIAGVIAYALSERLLPGIVDLSHSASAHGRLEQPLTYWNATGALAVLGLVLCMRMAADATRPRVLRAAAAAAGPILGLGVYLTFSRGALAALAAGVVGLTLLLLGSRRELWIVYAVLAAAALAALASELPGLDPIAHVGAGGATGAGLAMLAILAVLGVAAAVITLAWADETAAEPGARRPHRLTAAVAIVAVIGGGLALAASNDDYGRVGAGGAQRLATVESNRYEYWRVAASTFADHPVEGHGAGSFRVDWLRERDVRERVADGHSLYAETAAELGLLGLAALGLFLGGVAWAAVSALRFARMEAIGPVVVAAVWALHAGIDWLWEMPAVALVAVACAARLVVLADEGGRYAGAA
jgi:O-Antigen ligase